MAIDFGEKEKTWLGNLFEDIWFYITEFFDGWIYPAHKLKNLLFNRYDLVKLYKMKATDYSDVDYRMFEANMELIKFFIEKENPEKYVCWYKDDEGKEVGHKYGEYVTTPILYPELKGKYIMDLIKEIYNWYTVKLPQLEKDASYILGLWSDHMHNVWFEPTENLSAVDYYNWYSSDVDLTLEQADEKRFNWDILLKYFDKKEDALSAKNMSAMHSNIERKIEEQKQYYLHLCIEVRNYLWT